MPGIPIAKYEALQNDFLIVHSTETAFRWTAARVRILCDRRCGLGADGLIVIGESKGEKVSFRLFNADGRRAEWSGNGVRCAMAFLHDKNGRSEALFVTKAGTIRTTISSRGAGRRWAGFERPIPEVREARGAAPSGAPNRVPVFFVDAGNPHQVFLVPHFNFDWEKVGADCQRRATRTNGINVEFVQVVDRRSLALRLYERGVGPTPASGSGALVAIVVCRRKGLIDSRGRATSPGGTQSFEFDGDAACIRLYAPVRCAYTGRLDNLPA